MFPYDSYPIEQVARKQAKRCYQKFVDLLTPVNEPNDTSIHLSITVSHYYNIFNLLCFALLAGTLNHWWRTFRTSKKKGREIIPGPSPDKVASTKHRRLHFHYSGTGQSRTNEAGHIKSSTPEFLVTRVGRVR